MPFLHPRLNRPIWNSYGNYDHRTIQNPTFDTFGPWLTSQNRLILGGFWPNAEPCRASGAKAVVAMDSFRAWKAPVAPGEKHRETISPWNVSRIWCWWCWYVLVIKKQKKKHGEIFKKHIGDISYIQFSIWKSSRYLIASAGHLSKLPWTQCKGNALHHIWEETTTTVYRHPQVNDQVVLTVLSPHPKVEWISFRNIYCSSNWWSHLNAFRQHWTLASTHAVHDEFAMYVTDLFNLFAGWTVCV